MLFQLGDVQALTNVYVTEKSQAILRLHRSRVSMSFVIWYFI
jgi:hypothetical protein